MTELLSGEATNNNVTETLKQDTSRSATFRLIALWAFCESGLGGMLHAFKFPFTGLIVGGMAMLIVCLMASQNHRPGRKILEATLLVILVKFSISPHSPFAAYLAVGFQGVLGAILFSFLPYSIAAVLLLTVGMLESAMQSVLLAKLLYGQSLWTAIDLFFQKMSQALHVNMRSSFSFWFIVIYASLYFLWGLILGLWAVKLPALIARRTRAATPEANDMNQNQLFNHQAAIRKPRNILLPIIIALGISVLLACTSPQQRWFYVLLRTIGVLIILYFIVQPLFLFFLNRLKGNRSQQLQHLLHAVPDIQRTVQHAANHSLQYRGIKRIYEFFMMTFILTLHENRR